MRYTAKQLREAMVKAAKDYWPQQIEEPSRGEVSEPITALWDRVEFWDGWLRRPSGGGCPNGYTRPPDPDWCGIFVAACADRVGDFLEDDICVPVWVKPESQKYCLSSTLRLNTASKWEQAGLERPDQIDPGHIQAGDIVVVNPTTSAPYGTHITLARADVSGGDTFVDTYEGNATGLQPDGVSRHGVVKKRRPLDKVARVWRLDKTCFISRGDV